MGKDEDLKGLRDKLGIGKSSADSDHVSGIIEDDGDVPSDAIPPQTDPTLKELTGPSVEIKGIDDADVTAEIDDVEEIEDVELIDDTEVAAYSGAADYADDDHDNDDTDVADYSDGFVGSEAGDAGDTGETGPVDDFAVTEKFERLETPESIAAAETGDTPAPTEPREQTLKYGIVQPISRQVKAPQESTAQAQEEQRQRSLAKLLKRMQAEPLHDEPLHDEPLHDEPLHDEPLHDEPLHEPQKQLNDELQAEPHDAPREELHTMRIWQDDAKFFRREALSLAEHQPERAALLWLESAAASERGGQERDRILADLDAAITLRPESHWLLPLASRMLIRLGEFERALEIIQREVALGGENTVRSAMLHEAAALVRYHGTDPRLALQLLKQALILQPTDVIALNSAITLFADMGKLREAARCLEQLSLALTVANERALCLYAAGTLYEARLDQPDQAESCYRRALDADRENVPVAMALCTLYEQQDKLDQLCEILEHLAELVSEPSLQARYLHQAGSLHLDCTEKLEAAARDLNQAADVDPDNPSTLQRLAYVHESMGNAAAHVAALRKLLKVTRDALGRAALLAHIGWLLQTRLGEVDQAIEAYREALSNVESYLPAVQSLGTLYRHRDNYENLLEMYAPEVEGTLPAKARAMRCVEIGDILIKLQRWDEARQAFHRALELDPGLFIAFWALVRVLRRLGRFDDLADLLAAQSERSQDARTRNYLLLELARLQAGPLEETERALRTLESIQPKDQTRTVAVEILELYEHTGHLAEMVAFLLAQADDTADPAEAQGRRIQAASILEFQLEETERALNIYKQILEEDPLCVAAVRGAGRIYHRLGWWNELVKLHYHELVTDPQRPDSAILLCRIARILEEHLGQASAAIKSYAKALARDSACAPALPALERLVRSERRWQELVQVLESFAEARSDRMAAADALCRAAEIADWQLGDRERAQRLYRRARERDAASKEARNGLLRVFRRQGSWDGVDEMLQELIAAAESSEERGQHQLTLARLREHRLGAHPDLELYQAAVDTPSLGERLRAERIRVLRLNHSPVLTARLIDLGKRTADPALAAAHLLDSAHLLEFSGEFEDNLEARLEAGRLAYDRRPDEMAVVWSLERALSTSGQWSELGLLREKEAQLELDPAVRVVKLSAAAAAYLQADDLEEAGRVARESLNYDAHCLPALWVLVHLAEKQESWGHVAALYDRLAEACGNIENQMDCCLRAADLWADREGDTSRALASLAVALIHQPDQPEAFARAKALLGARAEYGELSRLYRRRIKFCQDPQDRIELLRQHARLLREDLRDNNRAIAELSELLTLAPDDVGALAEISDVLVAQGHWSDAVTALGQLAETAEEPALRRHARLRRAEVWLRHLHDLRQARTALDALLEDEPSDLEAIKLRVELATTAGNWEEAHAFLKEVASGDNRQSRVWASMKLAEVAHVGLADDDQRVAYEMDALEMAALDPDSLSMLIDTYRQEQEQQRLADRLEAILDSLGPRDSALLLSEAAARLYLEDLDRPGRALHHLKRCLAEDQSNQQHRLLFALALERIDDQEHAEQEYRSILHQEITSLDAYRGLARIMDRRGQHETVTAVAALVDLLGETEPEETAVLKGLEGTLSPPGRLDLNDLMQLPGDLEPVHDVLTLTLPHLRSVFPAPDHEVLPADDPATMACQRLAGPVGLGRINVAQSEGELVGAVAIAGDPPLVVLEPSLGRIPGNAVFRFWVGRALGGLATGGALLEQVIRSGEIKLDELMEALCSSRPSAPAAQQLRKMLGLPRKLRKQLEGLHPSSSPEIIGAYSTWQQQLADRIGMLMSRNPKTTITELARAANIDGSKLVGSPRLQHLMRFAVSDAYARLARSLWS